MRNTSKILLFAGLVALDQLSKQFIAKTSITIIKNSGLPFGINTPEFFSLPVILILLGVFIILYFRFQKQSNLGFTQHHFWESKSGAGFILILAGALSNILDRFSLGYVRDFIPLFNLSTFNLADIMIWLGIIILIFTV